jgi:sugar fermentation stimulation protein A
MKHMSAWPFQSPSFVKARFASRPNRFLVRCVHDQWGEVPAHLPNPGRLWELMLPGAVVYLHPCGNQVMGERSRKTRFTAVAVEREGNPVFLHTHATNDVAEHLIQREAISGLRGAAIARREVSVGRNRFDFLLSRNGRDLYLEVKSCTLFGNGVAMFPDAVTQRGTRHLLELAEMARGGIHTAVLFMVQSPHVAWFMPDYHTDLRFAHALLAVREEVEIVPVAIPWDKDLTLPQTATPLKIPWPYLNREVQDRGAYLLLIRLDRKQDIVVGQLGRFTFAKGYYVYVGSAMKQLTARLNRHGRKGKPTHWHVDYLLPIPVRASERLECSMAEALRTIMAPGPLRFGASDCDCPTHLFQSPGNPFHQRSFHDLIHRFRMRHPVRDPIPTQ